MAKVLIAWELGGNLGHVLPIRQLVKEFIIQGHQVFLVFKEVGISQAYFNDLDISMMQAPIWQHRRTSPDLPASMAEILMFSGYLDSSGLGGLVKAWLDCYSLVKPDVVVLDYAPTARLAAKIKGIPCANIGTGFQILPADQACPNIRYMDSSVTEQRLLESEDKCLHSINSVFSSYKKPKCDYVADLFNGESNYIMSIAELDHYPQRKNGLYQGILKSEQNFKRHVFKGHRKYKVFMYLHYTEMQLKPLISSLAGLDIELIAYCPNASRNIGECGVDIMISRNPIELNVLAKQADAAICHGGHGLTAQFILAGCPVIAIPQNQEQQLLGIRLREQQLGDMSTFDNISTQLNKKLMAVLTNVSYIENTKNIYTLYKDLNQHEVAKNIVNEVSNIKT